MTPRRRRWPGRLAGALLGVLAFAVLVVVVPGLPSGTVSAGAPATPVGQAAAATPGYAGSGGPAVVEGGAAGGPSWPDVTDLPATPASAGRATGPRAVLVVGDSLTVGTEPWLDQAVRGRGWTLMGVDARVGRGVPEGLSVLRSDIGSLPGGTVVVALGTNSLSATASDVAGWLRSARQIVGSRRLIWVNLCLDGRPGTWLGSYRQINRWLAAYAPDYGVQLADWCSFATRYGIDTGPDGIHYTSAAYQERAAFYAAAIAGWAGAFDQPGAP